MVSMSDVGETPKEPQTALSWVNISALSTAPRCSKRPVGCWPASCDTSVGMSGAGGSVCTRSHQ